MIRISFASTVSRSSRGELDLVVVELNKYSILNLVPEPIKVLHIPAKLSSSERQSFFREAGMASIPYAAYSAPKIHEHMKTKFTYDEEASEEPKTKLFRQNIFGLNKLLVNYNSKLMNSIWGQYNLYAAHAFQKNNEGSYSGIDFLNIPQVKDLWDVLRTAH